MTLAAQATAAGQARAEALMTDTGQLVRPSTTPTTDPVTGAVTYPEAEIYTGKARVRPGTGRQVEAGEDAIQVVTHTVSLPVSVTNVRPDDVWITTASVDASLLTLRLRVRSVARGTHITARRLGCEESS